jgi:hypothetical protein
LFDETDCDEDARSFVFHEPSLERLRVNGLPRRLSHTPGVKRIHFRTLGALRRPASIAAPPYYPPNGCVTQENSAWFACRNWPTELANALLPESATVPK